MDSSLYAQQSQSQSQYSSPLYMQHVYPQQQYPVYGIVPPTWTPSPTPYFETPLVRNATPTLHISRLLPGVIGIECIKCEVYNKAWKPEVEHQHKNKAFYRVGTKVGSSTHTRYCNIGMTWSNPHICFLLVLKLARINVHYVLFGRHFLIWGDWSPLTFFKLSFMPKQMHSHTIQCILWVCLLLTTTLFVVTSEKRCTYQTRLSLLAIWIVSWSKQYFV